MDSGMNGGMDVQGKNKNKDFEWSWKRVTVALMTSKTRQAGRQAGRQASKLSKKTNVRGRETSVV